MLKATLMTKKGAIKKTTDNALEWFPELEKLFENFEIEHITIRVENSTDKFLIFKDE
jgi:uncharacterized protein HemX